MPQNASMSFSGSRCSDNRDVTSAPHRDGRYHGWRASWSVAGAGAARPRPKAIDFSHFGRINKTAPMSFATTSVFDNKKGDPESCYSAVSRTPLSSNIFSTRMLQRWDVIADPPTSKGSRPFSCKLSVGLGVGSPPEPVPQRRKLQLLPRTRPVEEMLKVPTPAVSQGGSDDKEAESRSTPSPVAILEGWAKSKINEDVEEFFSVRMLNKAELYFSSLPTEHHHHLVDALATKSIEMKESDVRLVGDLFVRVREKDLCSPAAFEEGFLGLADLLDDLPVIIPKAWLYFAILLKGSGLDQDEERYARIAEKTMDPDRLNRLL
jgi:translation initiation factor 4G